MRLSSGDRLFIGSIYVFLVLLAFVAFYPFWNAAVISFNSGTDTMQGGVTFWPREFTLENYKVVFKDERLIDGFIISIFRTIVGTLLSVMATAILAYGISKPQLSGRNVYMVLCIITMYFSGGLIPSYLLIRELGLMNTFWVMVVPGIINVWNMIIFRTFFEEYRQGWRNRPESTDLPTGAYCFESYCRSPVRSLPPYRCLRPCTTGMTGLHRAFTFPIQICSRFRRSFSRS